TGRKRRAILARPRPLARPAVTLSRADCGALDRVDPLAAAREQFALPAGVIYLDGHSLRALPRATALSVARVGEREWGEGLIQSWNAAGWIDAPARVGDKIARLIGARAGEVIVADSTSVNLFKVLAAALDLARDRRVIVSEAENFPTDLYMMEGLVALQGGRHALRAGDREGLEAVGGGGAPGPGPPPPNSPPAARPR